MFQIIIMALAMGFPTDSLRMEVINGKPYVVHQVGEKETLYSLARRYGATIPGILEQNPTADSGLEVGQILKIPYAPRPKGEPPVPTADGLVHKVAPKETLFSIARMYNVSVDDIKSWNDLKDGTISIGQDIVIKRKDMLATETKPAQPVSAITHTVAPKETMFSIARQYGVTVQQLKDWNKLSGDELKIGQVLSVGGPALAIAAVPPGTPATSPVMPSEGAAKISESVSGMEEVKETGLAELIEGSEGNRKYLGQHRTIRPGTILKIRDITTNQEVFVRITGPIANTDATTIIRVSKSAFDRLGAKESKFRVEITYYK
jgi:LysM repeat protein